MCACMHVCMRGHLWHTCARQLDVDRAAASDGQSGLRIRANTAAIIDDSRLKRA